jgi:hypothetical protein
LRLTAFFVKRRAKWMFLTLMAPEILIGLALSQFVAARYGRDKMQLLASEDGVEWTLEHSYFADMGGFVVSFPDDPGNRESTGDAKSDTATAGENEILEGVPRERALNSIKEAPSLRRAVNLLPRAMTSVIKTPKDPRTQSLSAPLSRGIVNISSIAIAI